ncbi:hypothetical protein, partial [Sphingomonas sp. 2SG]|uniref:hypothetical protein n=1 Tax=Sphingomonas sp. 2SG TaxID=2502201 RepID=UPI001BB11C78
LATNQRDWRTSSRAGDRSAARPAHRLTGKRRPDVGRRLGDSVTNLFIVGRDFDQIAVRVSRPPTDTITLVVNDHSGRDNHA